MKRVLLCLSLVASSPAWAAGPRLNGCVFSFTMPTVSDADLTEFKLKIGSTPGGPYPFVATVPSPSPTGGITVTTGNLCSSLTNGQKYAVATAMDAAGNESPPSNEVAYFFDAVAPNSPTGLTVR